MLIKIVACLITENFAESDVNTWRKTRKDNSMTLFDKVRGSINNLTSGCEFWSGND